MQEDIMLFTKPEELAAWANKYAPETAVSASDAGLLMGYMEGHGYAVGSGADGKLYRRDMEEEHGETMEYTMDDMIDQVCEWNYELILDAEKRKNAAETPTAFEEELEYQKYKADEPRLDRLFDRTSYAKGIEALAERLANEFIENLNKGRSAEQAVSGLTEGIKQMQTGKGGR